MRYFEDFAPGEVVELGSITLDAEAIIAFGRQFDPQVFHVDAEGAKGSAFGGLVASGWHTCSVWMRLYVESVLGDATSVGSPGVDEVRWTVPVRPGDTLTGRWTVLECRPLRSRPDRGLVRSRGELFNQRGDLVMHLHSVNFFGRRHAGEAG